jgi:Ca2+-binding RTX toxin-like protein
VSDVEVLSLTVSSEVTLGRLADLAGITGVIGGSGSSTLTEGADFYSGVTLDGSNGSSNLFVVAGSIWLADDTILGGAGNDTLSLTTGDQVDDTLFGNVSGVEVLALSGASDVTLGSAAKAAGITSVIAGSGATSVDASSLTGALTIDLSGATASSQAIGGSGADTILGSSSADTLAGDTFAGGAGADTFVLGAKLTTITDFDVTADILNLRNFGGTVTDYSFGGIGGEGYTDQLFRNDTLGGSTLVANINVVDGGSSSDILAKALFA